MESVRTQMQLQKISNSQVWNILHQVQSDKVHNLQFNINYQC